MSPIFDGSTRLSTLATRMRRFASPNPSWPARGMSCWSRHEVKSVSGTTIPRLSVIHSPSQSRKIASSAARLSGPIFQYMTARISALMRIERSFFISEARRESRDAIGGERKQGSCSRSLSGGMNHRHADEDRNAPNLQCCHSDSRSVPGSGGRLRRALLRLEK